MEKLAPTAALNEREARSAFVNETTSPHAWASDVKTATWRQSSPHPSDRMGPDVFRTPKTLRNEIVGPFLP